MPAKSNASPAKPVSLLPAGALLFLAAVNAVLVFWLRELLSKDGVIRLLLVLASAPAAGAGSIVLLSGCVYGFGNLVSSRRRLTGIPIRWSRVFPAVCRFHVYLGLALTLLSMAALWFLPGAGGAMVSPRGFARTRPVFIRAAAPSMGRRTGCPLFC